MAYKVKLCLVKINEETGVEQLGSSFFAGELSFEQAKACIDEAKPVLDKMRDEWLAKDIE